MSNDLEETKASDPLCRECYPTIKKGLAALQFGRYAATTQWCPSCQARHHVKWRDVIEAFGTEDQRRAAQTEAEKVGRETAEVMSKIDHAAIAAALEAKGKT